MSPRPLVTGAVLAGLMLLFALAWRFGGYRERAGAAALDSDAGVATVVASESGDGRQDPARTPSGHHVRIGTVPLPAMETPLRLVVDDLGRRANAGDARAACRLAAEFERCQRLRTRVMRERAGLQRVRAQPHRAGSDDVDGLARLIARMEGALNDATKRLAHCASVDEPDAADRARYWRSAALAGHLPSMRHYASGNGFRFTDLMDALPELTVYRRDAESMARRAAAAGDAQMVYALAMAYSPRGAKPEEAGMSGFRPFLAQSVRADAHEALSWLYALQRHPGVVALPADHHLRVISDRGIQALVARTPAADVAAASESARERALAWTSAVADTAEFPVHANGGISSIAREDCERERFVQP